MPTKSKSYTLCYSRKIKSKPLSKLHSKKYYINEIKRHVKYWKKIDGRGGDDEFSKNTPLQKLKKVLSSYKSLVPEKLGYKSCKFKRSKSIKKRIKRIKRSKNSCIKQSLKKYKTRNSPPYPANKCCGKIKKGNDKKMYVSKKNGSSCKWLKTSRK